MKARSALAVTVCVSCEVVHAAAPDYGIGTIIGMAIGSGYLLLAGLVCAVARWLGGKKPFFVSVGIFVAIPILWFLYQEFENANLDRQRIAHNENVVRLCAKAKEEVFLRKKIEGVSELNLRTEGAVANQVNNLAVSLSEFADAIAKNPRLNTRFRVTREGKVDKQKGDESEKPRYEIVISNVTSATNDGSRWRIEELRIEIVESKSSKVLARKQDFYGWFDGGCKGGFGTRAQYLSSFIERVLEWE